VGIPHFITPAHPYWIVTVGRLSVPLGLASKGSTASTPLEMPQQEHRGCYPFYCPQLSVGRVTL